MNPQVTKWKLLVELWNDAGDDSDRDAFAAACDGPTLGGLAREFYAALNTVARGLVLKNLAKLRGGALGPGVDAQAEIAHFTSDLRSEIWTAFNKTRSNWREGETPRVSFSRYLSGIGKHVVADQIAKMVKRRRREVSISDENVVATSTRAGHLQIDYNWLSSVAISFSLQGYIQNRYKGLADQVVWLCSLAHQMAVQVAPRKIGKNTVADFSLKNRLLIDAVRDRLLMPYLLGRSAQTRDEFYRHCLRVEYQVKLCAHFSALIRSKKSAAPDVREYVQRGGFEDDSAIYRGAQQADTDAFRRLTESNKSKRKTLKLGDENQRTIRFALEDAMAFGEDLFGLFTAPAEHDIGSAVNVGNHPQTLAS